MNDRDQFAAAALTGLLHGNYIYDLKVMARQAYENADAMLREREPAAKPMPTAVSEQEPVAWAVQFDDEDNPDTDFLFSTLERAENWSCKRGATPVPLYRQPQPTLTDAEREAIDPVDFGGLTDEERKALAYYIGTGGPDTVDAALRTLLERTK
jgi:hypothetical protein